MPNRWIRYLVSNKQQYYRAIEKVRNIEGSEGAMVITADSPYETKTKANRGWSKLKNLKECDTLVVERKIPSGSTNRFYYRMAVGPLPSKCAKILKEHKPKRVYEFERKSYVILGKSFTGSINVPKHRILRVAVDEILKDAVLDENDEPTGCYVYSAVKPVQIAYVKERGHSCDGIKVMDRLSELSLPRKMKKQERLSKPFAGFKDWNACMAYARSRDDISNPKAYCGWLKHRFEKRMTPEDYKELAKEGEPLPAECYEYHPTEKLRYVFQYHYPSKQREDEKEKPMIPEETKKSTMEYSLLWNLSQIDAIKKFRDHIDLRLEVKKGKEAIGWALHPPQNVEGGVWGELKRRIHSHTQTQAAAKVPMLGKSLDWLEVGKKGNIKLERGKPGASSTREAWMVAKDWGTVQFGVLRDDLKEFFLQSEKHSFISGRWIARILSIRGKKSWLVWKPKDQMPMNPDEHDDSGSYKVKVLR